MFRRYRFFSVAFSPQGPSSGSGALGKGPRMKNCPRGRPKTSGSNQALLGPHSGVLLRCLLHLFSTRGPRGSRPPSQGPVWHPRECVLAISEPENGSRRPNTANPEEWCRRGSKRDVFVASCADSCQSTNLFTRCSGAGEPQKGLRRDVHGYDSSMLHDTASGLER